MSETPERLYKVVFHNQGMVYEIFAKEVGQGGLFGFIEVQHLVFGAKTTVVIDPTEDRLKTEFEGVERMHIPMHSVIRIDEVRKEGRSRILETSGDGGSVAPFPVPIYAPNRDSEGS